MWIVPYLLIGAAAAAAGWFLSVDALVVISLVALIVVAFGLKGRNRDVSSGAIVFWICMAVIAAVVLMWCTAAACRWGSVNYSHVLW